MDVNLNQNSSTTYVSLSRLRRTDVFTCFHMLNAIIEHTSILWKLFGLFRPIVFANPGNALSMCSVVLVRTPRFILTSQPTTASELIARVNCI